MCWCRAMRSAQYDEPEAMRGHLIEAGVAADRLMLDHRGLDTYDSCWRARDIFGVDRLMVVAQGYHLPRAVATARPWAWTPWGSATASPPARRGEGLNEPWARGWVRDQVACVKTLWDVGTRRRPTR